MNGRGQVPVAPIRHTLTVFRLRHSEKTEKSHIFMDGITPQLRVVFSAGVTEIPIMPPNPAAMGGDIACIEQVSPDVG